MYVCVVHQSVLPEIQKSICPPAMRCRQQPTEIRLSSSRAASEFSGKSRPDACQRFFNSGTFMWACQRLNLGGLRSVDFPRRTKAGYASNDAMRPCSAIISLFLFLLRILSLSRSQSKSAVFPCAETLMCTAEDIIS